MPKKTAILFIFTALLLACSSEKEKKKSTVDKNATASISDKPTEVKAKPVRREMFHYELCSNGTVSSLRRAELNFKSLEVVTSIFVQNGDKVSKGQKLASQDAFMLRNSLAQANDNMERAKLELQDVLIGQGYSLKNPDAIPADILKIAKVKSNSEQSRINLEMAEYNLKVATLYAPFSGVVANLFTKANNRPDGSQPFCSIVDIEHPEVVFKVLENELPQVRKGDPVLVSPFSSESEVSKGKVIEINPVVDKNGMVLVKASVDNSKGRFCDGMNVQVRVQRALSKQLLIPKVALVLRDNRKVVFTCKKGVALWNYVQTDMENSESLVVTEGLQEGDSVIYEGNINLAHESPVVVK